MAQLLVDGMPGETVEDQLAQELRIRFLHLPYMISHILWKAHIELD